MAGPVTELESKGTGLADAKEPLVAGLTGDYGGDEEKGDSVLSPAVFRWGERPVQDALYGNIFLAGMAILLLRQLFIFFWPVLSLKLVDPATFSLSPFMSIILGVVLALPGCFLLLWACKSASSSTVRGCLVIVTAFFVLSLLLAVVFHHTPKAGTNDEPFMEEMFDEPRPAEPGAKSRPVVIPDLPLDLGGVLGGNAQETAVLDAAIPATIERILLSSRHIAVTGASHISRLAHRTVAHVARRVLHTAALLSHSGDLVQRDRLVLAEAVLNDLLNAAGALALLHYCKGLFPLAAVVIADSSKFVLTRGRGLVFAVMAVAAAGIGASPFLLNASLQVSKACEAEHKGGVDTPALLADKNLCNQWKDAVFVDPLSGAIFTVLGFFLAGWFIALVQSVLQFVAAHVVGQCYGNTGASMEEDDMHAVYKAFKCAGIESFGTLCLLSLLHMTAVAASIILNLILMFLMGDSILASVPLVVNSVLFFCFSLFLSCFVLPIVALSGQGFMDATYSAIALIQRNLLSAVAVTLSSVCVVGVLFFIVLALTGMAGFMLSLLLASLGNNDGVQFLLWLMFLAILSLGTILVSLTLFHWVFGTTISCLFLCLAMEGKATETTTTTPLAPQE